MSLNMTAATDARLILSDDALDRMLELFLLAEAAVWITADSGLDAEPRGLGRGHFRAAFLLKRRPGLGVQELARLTGLSKQGASRVLTDLISAGYAHKTAIGGDARRRPAELTDAGQAFEARITQKLRAALGRAYRVAGMENAPAAATVLKALAGAVHRDADLKS